jgi:hypothetical protein
MKKILLLVVVTLLIGALPPDGIAGVHRRVFM